MSLSQTDNVTPLFGTNQGIWKYFDIDNQFLGYLVRKEQATGKKYFEPWTFQNGEWVKKWLRDSQDNILPKPIYNIQLLKQMPNRPVIIVEGEKTADSASLLFPDYNVLTAMGGAQSFKKIDWSVLAGLTVYLIPDNDEPGYDAMEFVSKKLLSLCEAVYFVNVASLGVDKGWDLADINYGQVEFEDVVRLLVETKPLKVTVDEFDPTNFPHLSDHKKPKPLDTAANFKFLLDHYKIKPKWNMMSRIREVIVPGSNFYTEERDNAALNFITDMAVTHNLPTKRVDKHLDAISWDNLYHPVRDWILSAPLLDNDIFHKFLTCIKTTNDELSRILIKRWMLSAISAVFTDTGFCAQGVLVIQGEPNTHKSSFIMSLAPQELRAIKGGLSLDPAKKDDIFTSAEYWIAELGELDATFRKADIARLKSHITNDIDDVRRPHAIRNSRMVRRTIYAATVNESRFLVDKTGNRRWWTISVTEPIHTRHGLDMQQVWRFIYELYLKGESPLLTQNEMSQLNKANEEFEFLDPFEEKLDTHFDWEWTERIWMNSSEVLQRIGYDKPTEHDCTKMGRLLTKRNIQKGTGRMRRHYLMPIFVPLR